MSNFVRKANHCQNEAYSKEEADTILSTKADSTDVYTKDEVYTQTEVDSKVSALNTSISTKANSSDVYTKSNVYTKTEIDSKVSTLNTSISAKQGTILYGTSTPSSSTGSNGDVYIKYS